LGIANDLNNFEIELFNKQFFTNLNEYYLEWELKSDGIILDAGKIDKLDVSPRQSNFIRINAQEPQISGNTEYFLSIYLKQKNENNLIPSSHIIANEQFKLPFYNEKALVANEAYNWLHSVSNNEITVSSENVKVVFSKETGELSHLQFKGEELFQQGFLPNFWRATTDNDKGNRTAEKAKMWLDASNSRGLSDINVEIIDKQISVQVDYTFSDLAKERIIYTFANDDNIFVDVAFEAIKDSVPDIPRLGLNFKLKKDFDSVEWFGRGPFENYEDRKTAAFIDFYKSSVDDLYFPYVRPQENGNRTDVRWLSLINNNIGLLIDGQNIFSFSALPYTIADLDLMQEPVYMHINELKKRDFIYVNIDYKQQGVGGDDSWYTPVHPEYRIKAELITYKMRLKLYDVSKDNVLDLSKQNIK